jgi:hypothetical protein
MTRNPHLLGQVLPHPQKSKKPGKPAKPGLPGTISIKKVITQIVSNTR